MTMSPWYERTVLVAGILAAVPFLLIGILGDPLALVGVPFTTLAAFFIYVRLRRQRLHPAPLDLSPRPDRRPPIPPVDEEALEALPEPVTACPDCAYVGIRMPELRDGLWPGGGELGSRVVCPRCGYQGIAVRFEKREEYGAFLRDLARDRSARVSAAEGESA